MNCFACGCDQISGARFCRQCGAPIAMPAAPPPPAAAYAAYGAAVLEAEKRMRVRQNLQPIGIMWVIFGVYRIVGGLIGGAFLHHMVRGGVFNEAPPFIPEVLGSLWPVVVLYSAVFGGAAILAGIGLLSRQPWGRTAAIILAILALIKFPFGTGLGIYTLWVMAPSASGAEWELLSHER